MSKANEVESIRLVSLDDRLWFGMHRGEKISEAPEDYIGWCIEQGIFSLGKHRDDNFKEWLRLQRAEDEAVFDDLHGDWGDRD